VGKTSIVLRFVRNEYSDRQASTLQASYLDKNITLGTQVSSAAAVSHTLWFAHPTGFCCCPAQQSVKLSIWDTAGQERFHALGPLYYRDANGALLVYDITDAQSFERVCLLPLTPLLIAPPWPPHLVLNCVCLQVGRWVKELRKIVGPDISIVIAGNKCDLEKDRNVDHEEAVKYVLACSIPRWRP